MAGVADKNALKAGIFIVVALLMGLAVFVAVRGGDFLGFGGREYVVRFDVGENISGLGQGGAVQVGGLSLGSVQGTELGEDGRTVDVRISLPDDVPLRQNPRVSVQSTVTGVPSLNFDSVGEGDRLEAGSVIDGRGGSITSLVDSVSGFAPAAQRLIERLGDETIPKANAALDSTTATMRNVDSVIGENRQDLRQALANVDDAAARLPGLLDEIEAAVEGIDDTVGFVRDTLDGTADKLDETLASADRAVDTVAGAADNVGSAARSAESVIAGNRGKIAQIIDRSREAATTLELATSEIRRSPWRLLYKPGDGQRRSLDLYDAARRFAEGANALQDAAVALQDATNDPAADQAEVREIVDRLEKRFATFDQVQTELYRQLRE